MPAVLRTKGVGQLTGRGRLHGVAECGDELVTRRPAEIAAIQRAAGVLGVLGRQRDEIVSRLELVVDLADERLCFGLRTDLRRHDQDMAQERLLFLLHPRAPLLEQLHDVDTAGAPDGLGGLAGLQRQNLIRKEARQLPGPAPAQITALQRATACGAGDRHLREIRAGPELLNDLLGRLGRLQDRFLGCLVVDGEQNVADPELV